MARNNREKVGSWTAATITTLGGANDKCFEFPRALAFAQPAIVRKNRSGRAVVAASFRPAAGRAEAIIASARMLEKLGCEANDAVEYKTASFLNVLWATKVALLLAVLGCGVVIGTVVIAVAALYPQSHLAVHVAWIGGILTVIVAVVILIISVVMAYKEP